MYRYLAALLLAAGMAWGQSSPADGSVAPGFSLKDHQGKSITLSQYSNQVVVLEWINFECPFVKKHYGSQKMQELQKKYRAQGVVWLSINSSARGKQGYFSNKEISQRLMSLQAQPDAYLKDTSGTVGRLYGAKTTPHIFIIKQGVIIYQGAADSIRSTDPADIPLAVNYIDKVLNEVLSGKTVSQESTAPYGCSVKY